MNSVLVRAVMLETLSAAGGKMPTEEFFARVMAIGCSRRSIERERYNLGLRAYREPTHWMIATPEHAERIGLLKAGKFGPV